MPLTGECKKQYQLEWLAARRAAYLADKSCAVCGSTTNLEIDHIDPSKKVSHRIWSWSKARREAELAKCQILCITHHREKTALMYTPPSHGTHSSYVHGCRCPDCRRAHREEASRYRKEHFA